MDADHEHLSLSDRERSALAELEALLTATDPEFSRRLEGRRGLSAWRRWLGPMVFGLGAMILLATFTTSLWFGVAGAAIMAAGLALISARVAVCFQRNRRNRP